MLVVDDAQWVDEPSLRFLAVPARPAARAADRPPGRRAHGRAGRGRAPASQLTGDPAATVCEPAPLGAGGRRRPRPRARARTRTTSSAARCAELTAGNPLGVRELAAAPWPTAPPGGPGRRRRAGGALAVARLVLRRLARAERRTPARSREAVAVFEGGVALHRAAALAGPDAARTPWPPRTTSPARGHPRGRRPARVHASAAARRGLRRARAAAAGRRRTAAPPRCCSRRGVPSEQVAAHLLADRAGGRRRGGRRAPRRGAARDRRRACPRSAVRLSRAGAAGAAGADGARPDVLAELGQAEAHRRATPRDRALRGGDRPRRRSRSPRRARPRARPRDARRRASRGRLRAPSSGAASSRERMPASWPLELEAWYLTSARPRCPHRAPDAHRRVDAILEHRTARPSTPGQPGARRARR